MKRRYKVLPNKLGPRMEFLYDDAEKGFVEEGVWTQIDPIFNRDGWYYDRKTKRSWYEFKGRAFTKDHTERQFLYELNMLDHEILSEEEVRAIETLLVMGACGPEAKKHLRKILVRSKEKSQSRDTYRSTYMFVMRYRRDLASQD